MNKLDDNKSWRGFWDTLPKPIFALAPMYDVTDAAFRRVIAKHGKPDVFYTEFVSTDGLMSEGRKKLINHLWFDKTEQPVVAQLFGAKPEKFEGTAALVREFGFAGIDINMGCPDKNIIKGGSCAALFKTPELARDIVLATKRGAEKDGTTIPVSVKIRIGDTKIDWENWISVLLEAQPAAITIHLRTRKEMSKVPAHWDEMPKIVQFINERTTPETRPLIIGNGDVNSLQEAKQKVEQTGCDGVMLGRAIFGNPWLFTHKDTVRSNGDSTNSQSFPEVTREQKLDALLEHVQTYNEIFKDVKPFDIMKRHFKAYIHGFDGAAELRTELYECKTAEEVEAVIKTHSK